VLILVKYLVNGTSVAQARVDTVTYDHVELPAHDVVLADGLAAESDLETGDRANFANAGAVIRQVPDFSARAWEPIGCAPLVVTGAELANARARLDAAPRNEAWPDPARGLAQLCTGDGSAAGAAVGGGP
jgi:hypothetical protein